MKTFQFLLRRGAAATSACVAVAGQSTLPRVALAARAAATTSQHRSMFLNSAAEANRRAFSTSAAAAQVPPELELPTGLTSTRGLLAIGGEAKTDFIQGMVTNDVTRLASGEVNSLYCLFLDAKGRTMFDVHIHNWIDGKWLVDCDIGVLPDLHKHLKKFRLRKKVTLEDVSDEYGVCTGNDALLEHHGLVAGGIDARVHPLTASVEAAAAPPSGGLVRGVVAKEVAEALPGTVEAYNYFRVWHGLGEGPTDYHPGKALPLECNLDYLGGVSFSKGCYLGQELTARTHHTGVVRKRFLPVDLYSNGAGAGAGDGAGDGAGTVTLEPGDSIVASSGKAAGRVRSVVMHSSDDDDGGDGSKGCALVLFRLSFMEDAEPFTFKNAGQSITGVPRRPLWWPDAEVAEK